MNYKKKWQGALLKKLHEQGEVRIETRNATEIKYLSELEDSGKIQLTNANGVWVCKLK